MQLILNTEGLYLRIEDGSFVVSHEKNKQIISPLQVTSIVVTEHALISSAAILLAVEHSILVHIADPTTGKPEARLDSVRFSNLADVRRRQVLFALTPEATQWVISLFELKWAFQSENLDFLSRRKTSDADAIAQLRQNTEGVLAGFQKHKDSLIEVCRNNLMGIEGTIAKGYWQAIANGFEDPSVFDGRSRRPATDWFNAALNYAYGMLYNTVENAVLAAGLDPQLGFLHTDEYDAPTLVFDLIEPFRAWVDRLLMEAYLTKQFTAAHFTVSPDGKGIWLSKEGKSLLIPMLNAYLLEKTRWDGKLLSRKTHIHRFAGEFVKKLRSIDFNSKL